MVKNFLEWMGVKERLEHRSEKNLYFKEGEVWWVAIGENIGVEVSGKGTGFSRPMLVYKKLSQESFLGIPLTTHIKQGSWYISFAFAESIACANLAQIRVVSAARLYTKLGDATTENFAKVKSGFLRLYS